MITYIYTLTDPVTNIPMYIGKTKQSPKRRYSQHISSELNSNTKKSNWIKSLKSKGLKPILDVIDETEDESWEWLEKYWISQFKCWGFNLKNLTDGGDGNKNQKFSFESIEKRRLKLLGKKRPLDVRLKISNSHKGKVLSNVTKEKLRLCNIGKKQSKETIQKRCKIVELYDKNDMFIQEFNSIKDAAVFIKGSKGTLWQTLNSNYYYKGYKIKYKKDIV